ncbi:hypothetical protein [Actibacterium sp. XHP0104]|uniref:hypothetical protein n=1 Tax=Actibacterium sp. XHP0104 TaxID=2984335 RepID=UPI0021E76DB0|nr:hypothetical protein [Actibacterium sp. XHP0104]MCV2882374.1 hypothetical protein [Actibacterium sp. XHP0104]
MTKLTLENHLERDTRLDCWSVHGIGPYSHSTDDWVKMVLDVSLEVDLPPFLVEMFDRAQASMVYGCYYYPLFTLGIEELFRFGESAFREAVKEAEPCSSLNRKRYADLQKWASEAGLIDTATASRWNASRRLRNSVSHKDGAFLLGPNDALEQLDITKELVESLFINCRDYARRNLRTQINE